MQKTQQISKTKHRLKTQQNYKDPNKFQIPNQNATYSGCKRSESLRRRDVKCADCRGVVEGLEPGGDEAWTLDGQSVGVSLSQTLRVWVNRQS
jgi:hypothetical protein